jgi:hypothetical protein
MDNYKTRKENRHKRQEAEKKRMPKHGMSVRKIIVIQAKKDKKIIETKKRVGE